TPTVQIVVVVIVGTRLIVVVTTVGRRIVVLVIVIIVGISIPMSVIVAFGKLNSESSIRGNGPDGIRCLVQFDTGLPTNVGTPSRHRSLLVAYHDQVHQHAGSCVPRAAHYRTPDHRNGPADNHCADPDCTACPRNRCADCADCRTPACHRDRPNLRSTNSCYRSRPCGTSC
uniref:Uncharacterized protein n=1 Tax=Anopheles minimus TaxID=112268 RepID=A0A182WNY4_9DIPT